VTECRDASVESMECRLGSVGRRTAFGWKWDWHNGRCKDYSLPVWRMPRYYKWRFSWLSWL